MDAPSLALVRRLRLEPKLATPASEVQEERRALHLTLKAEPSAVVPITLTRSNDPAANSPTMLPELPTLTKLRRLRLDPVDVAASDEKAPPNLP
jgi:hypothetical protein